MLHSLRTHALWADDVAAARDWYAALTGIVAYFDQPFYVGFELGGYELGVVPRSSDTEGIVGNVAYWGVDDLDGALARAVAAGAVVVEPLRDVGANIRLCTVRDPFGNLLGLIDNPNFRVPALGATVVADRPIAMAAPDGVLAPAEIHRSVEVAASPAQAFAEWTNGEQMTRWLGVPTEIELRIGGPYEVHFMADAPEGARGSERCCVLSFLPGRMVSFTWNAPPDQPQTRSLHTWVVLQFTESDIGTRLDLHHTGWPAAGFDASGRPLDNSPWAETFTYFERAWGRMLAAWVQSRGS